MSRMILSLSERKEVFTMWSRDTHPYSSPNPAAASKDNFDMLIACKRLRKASILLFIVVYVST